jgi:hypothetical protein
MQKEMKQIIEYCKECLAVYILNIEHSGNVILMESLQVVYALIVGGSNLIFELQTDLLLP